MPLRGLQRLRGMQMLPNDADFNKAVDWLAKVARDAGELPTRLDRLVRVFVTRPPKGDANGEWRALGAMLEDVRYVVFNIPAHLAEEQRRHFVAVLKPLAQSKDYAWRATEQEESADESCAVHIGNATRECSVTLRRRLTAEWKSVWNEYARLTYALEERGILTWNQLLLHGCRDPKPFGLSWIGDGDGGDKYYVRAEERILHALGIDMPAGTPRAVWNGTLADLPPRLDQWPELPSEIVQSFSDLGPLEKVDLARTPSASIYHLLRSYARWGGGAFISIPVVLASGADRNTSAVLSICSERPLSPASVLRWRLLAESILPVIASSELVTQFHVRRVAEEVALGQAEAWAHEVKNRTAPMIACLARASAADPTLESDTSRALHGALILNAVSYAVQLALGSSQKLGRLTLASAPPILEAVLQYLLNYHAASTRDKLTWTPRWSLEECVARLSDLLAVSGGRNLGERAQNVLVRPEVVYSTALLREVVQNVRVNSAVRGDNRIGITYSLKPVGDTIIVEMEQRQRELTITFRPELGRGIQATNKLFGERLGLGYIEVDPVTEELGSGSSWDGRNVLIRSRAVFMVGS